MKNQMIVGILVSSVVAGGIGFFVGTKFQPSRPGTFNRQFVTAGARGGGMRGSFMPVGGSILSVDDKSITVKLPDGSSKIVLLSDKTVISKAQAGSKTDLTAGVTVAVFGQANTDGSVSAQNIQINPIGRMGFGSSSASPAPAGK